jgi:EAL domain-containing protein (putative c-di-GMP-specific phosphodiesterase class I)
LGRGAGSVEAQLKTLSHAGVRIALDDFGTGYASLSHLSQFPVDLLKIDQSFVRDLTKKGEAAAIAAAIVNLGHCLGLEVVAEGIETEMQAARLLAMGCDAAQGYLYSRAVAAASVPRILAQWRQPVKAIAAS